MNVKAGDVVGIAVDLDSWNLTFYINGVAQGTAFAKTMYAGTYYPYLSDPFADRTSGLTMTVNFGQNAFKYAVPAGYHAGWYN